jgi:hypothetical protein
MRKLGKFRYSPNGTLRKALWAQKRNLDRNENRLACIAHKSLEISERCRLTRSSHSQRFSATPGDRLVGGIPSGVFPGANSGFGDLCHDCRECLEHYREIQPQ